MNEFEFQEHYSMLKKMRFSGMAEELRRQYENPRIHLQSAEERIFSLIDAENEVRRSKKFERLIKKASLRYPGASINESLYKTEGMDPELLEQLSECAWIREGRNLLVAGKTGVGKSWCICALGAAAASHFYSVKYYKASELLRLLQSSEDQRTLTETINKLSAVDLLIIDDFGLMNLNMEMCRNLFELIDARDGRKSTVLASQIPISSWYDLFGESTFADACLDRLTGNGSYRIELGGDSKRRQ